LKYLANLVKPVVCQSGKKPPAKKFINNYTGKRRVARLGEQKSHLTGGFFLWSVGVTIHIRTTFPGFCREQKGLNELLAGNVGNFCNKAERDLLCGSWH
jgi:hypothetical protein